MKYVIVSTAVTDETYQYGTTAPTVSLGGAGTYGLVGAKIWTDDVALVTGVGADFVETHGAWFETNRLHTQHLIVKDEHTPKTLVKYFEDGERQETPAYGAEHYRSMEASAADIGEALRPGVKGIYIFKEAELAFWDEIDALKQKFGFKLMWEINADSADYALISTVRQIAERVDMFSINRTEAQSLLRKDNVEEIIAEFAAWDTPLVFLRDGARGAFMISGEEVVHAPVVPDLDVIDATGGGNSSSAGVLFGICEGYSPYEAGIIGSISASICLRQEGVPLRLNEGLRQDAIELLNKMREEN
ncbi:carbohydrate kinase family protein [Paenibacillus paeoniae]|uniref:Carbohydrate kinase family protein n=1 Tax=Paenibacillus paeoniae TaxID=2292705 RepID=A0A371PNF7_9BACL|nr:PfkB family carbohydrate kinase [Paenibacillus paeoniae]REK77726.1 carbohydrate kinase family protein [Paenibacillus paeoniae]